MFGRKKSDTGQKPPTAKRGTLKPIEIFKAGTHKTNDGRTLTFTKSDVQAIADAYDPAVRETPLVVGHPKTDDPAYGWVQSLECRDGTLYATPKDGVDPDFADAVNAGRYNRVSSAFYAPGHDANPKKGAYYLRHVGFLGAAAPAVAGLKPAQIASDADEPVLFSECALSFSEAVDPWRRTATPASLAQRARDLGRLEDGVRIGELMRQGRVLPYMKDAVVAFCEALDDDRVLEFSEGGEEKTLGMHAAFLDFLAKLPKMVEFSEVAHRGNDVMDATQNWQINLPKGVEADPAGLELHKKALIHQAATKCSYGDAVHAVAGGK